jgi:hypothetical protein
MDVTKPYEFIGFGAMDVTKPYKFIGFGAMDVTKPYKFIGRLLDYINMIVPAVGIALEPGIVSYRASFSRVSASILPCPAHIFAYPDKIGLPGRILARLLPGRYRNRRSGRPKAGRRAEFGVFQVPVRPNSCPEGPISGPEALLRCIE